MSIDLPIVIILSTVSHICNFIGRLDAVIIFEPNYTPIVESWSNLNFFYMNCNNMHDLPTPHLNQ